MFIVYKLARKCKGSRGKKNFRSLIAKGKYDTKYAIGKKTEAPDRTLGLYAYKRLVDAVKQFEYLKVAEARRFKDIVILACKTRKHGTSRGRAGCANEYFLRRFYAEKVKNRIKLKNLDGARNYLELTPVSVVMDRVK